MKRQHDFKLRLYWKLITLLLMASSVILSNVPAQAQIVNVKVLIEYTGWHVCSDPFSPPDIYHVVEINGVEHNSRDNPIESNFGGPFAVGREFSVEVDASQRNIPIIISEWDADSVGDDDQCDIQPGSGESLDLNLDLATCEISGDATGVCGTTIEPIFNFGFRIDIEEPPHAAGLIVRCLHDPIWPQPGDQVTITADALDANAVSKGGVIDDIEIWVDDINTPVANTAATPGSFGVNTFTFNYTPTAGTDQILYRCRVSDDGEEVSSGWRIVQIGDPSSSWIRSVPIIQTGPFDSRVDIVFIADDNDYTGPDDPQFLTDVHSVIRDAYYASGLGNSGLPFLINQNLINFWIALDQGTAVEFNHGSHDPPDDWDSRYHFADAGAIVHTTVFRDQANRGARLFSSEPTSLGTFLHETGHTPFGMADEYCCDSNYHQPDPFPNIYDDQGDCLDDELATGVADACRQIQSGTNTINWFRLDSHSTVGDDLMRGSGNRTSRPAELRRFDWLFDICRGAGC